MTPSKEALKAAKEMVRAIIKNPFLTDIEVARVIDSAFAARMKAAEGMAEAGHALYRMLPANFQHWPEVEDFKESVRNWKEL